MPAIGKAIRSSCLYRTAIKNFLFSVKSDFVTGIRHFPFQNMNTFQIL